MRITKIIATMLIFAMPVLLPDAAQSAGGSKKPEINETERRVIGLLDKIDEESDERHKIIEKLNEVHEEGLPYIFKMLHDGSDEMQQKAAYALGRMRIEPDEIVPALTKALSYGERVHVSASQSLRRVGEKALPTFLKALKSDDSDIRESAVFAIGRMRINSKVSVHALLRAMQDEDREVRGSAAYALGEVRARSPEVVAALIAALQEKDNRMRINSAKALEKIGRPAAEKAVPALIASLEDPNVWVRKNASRALKKIDTPEARKALDEHSL